MPDNPDDTDSAALSLITMQKETTEASNNNTAEVPSTAKKVADSIAAAAANEWPPHPWRPLTDLLPLARTRSRSRSRSRTRDLPPSAVKPSADASSPRPSEAPEEGQTLQDRLQNDKKVLFIWRAGFTNRLDGQNRKVDAAWATANEGVRLAKIAGVSASDAMTRANDAMKQAEEALKRAKNAFNTAINEHGPSLRKTKDRVAHLEKQVEDLDRDSRAMSRTLISGGASAAGGSGEISDLRSDVRRLQASDPVRGASRPCRRTRRRAPTTGCSGMAAGSALCIWRCQRVMRRHRHRHRVSLRQAHRYRYLRAPVAVDPFPCCVPSPRPSAPSSPRTSAAASPCRSRPSTSARGHLSSSRHSRQDGSAGSWAGETGWIRLD